MHVSTPDFRYRREVLRDAPVLYWPLDTTNFAVDYRPAASPLPGTAHGTLSLVPGPMAGAATVYDGSTAYFEQAYTASINPNPMTFEAWVNPTGGAGTFRCVAAEDTGAIGWRLFADSSNRWNFFQEGVDNTIYSTVILNVWTHIAVSTSNAGPTIMYINGVPVATSAFGINTNTTSVFRVGQDSNGGNWFVGNIAHVAIYGSTLSPNRIATHYAARYPRARRSASMTFKPRPRQFLPPVEHAEQPFRRRSVFLGTPTFKLLRGLARFAPPHDETPFRIPLGPRMIDFGRRYGAARGLYRVFNAAAYRFYRSSTGAPLETDTPFATSATLPNTPATTYADGTWYISVSYFNGVLDSGFLPLGAHGETYLKLEISGGVGVSTRPSGPTSINLELRAGGVVRINAFYIATPDGTNRATEWAVAYTTDGTTPAVNTPTITKTMTTGPLQVLAYDLPAQANGTTVKVQLQTRRTDAGPVFSYSLASTVQTTTADATGPTAPLQLVSWAGGLPDTEGD